MTSMSLKQKIQLTTIRIIDVLLNMLSFAALTYVITFLTFSTTWDLHAAAVGALFGVVKGIYDWIKMGDEEFITTIQTAYPRQ